MTVDDALKPSVADNLLHRRIGPEIGASQPRRARHHDHRNATCLCPPRHRTARICDWHVHDDLAQGLENSSADGQDVHVADDDDGLHRTFHQGRSRPSVARPLRVHSPILNHGAVRSVFENGQWVEKTIYGANMTVNEYGLPVFANFFFFITGFHGFHVFSGVIINIIIFINVIKGTYEKRGHYEMIEKTGLYWHFVDLVWVFVFTFFYLL